MKVQQTHLIAVAGARPAAEDVHVYICMHIHTQSHTHTLSDTHTHTHTHTPDMNSRRAPSGRTRACRCGSRRSCGAGWRAPPQCAAAREVGRGVIEFDM
jgi:hypothetical protein